jgi:GDSL-like lipase/acylhydrolase family protein
MRHVVLLGDSIFENAAYVGTAPDVRKQLKEMMRRDDRVTLAARDGAVLNDVRSQLVGIPKDATHLVISAGGNDALQGSGILDEAATSVAEALEKLAAVAEPFRENYDDMLRQARERSLPTAVCTIYEPRFPDISRRLTAARALTILNDQITRQAASNRLALIDLRVICDRDEDFANPIEPSAVGGAKIAHAVMRFASGALPSAAVY